MYPRLFEVQGSVYEWQSIKVKGFGFCAMSISDRTACMLCPVRLFVTPWTVAHQAPLVHGISQARILEWVAISFSRGSSQYLGPAHQNKTQFPLQSVSPMRKLP